MLNIPWFPAPNRFFRLIRFIVRLPLFYAMFCLVVVPIIVPLYYRHQQDQKREDRFYASLTFMDMHELTRGEQEILMVCMYNLKTKSESIFKTSQTTSNALYLRSLLGSIMSDKVISKTEYNDWLHQYDIKGFRYEIKKLQNRPLNASGDKGKVIVQRTTEKFGM